MCALYVERYDDTDLLLREYSENSPDTARSKDAIDRVNAIHGMYAKQISNADMLFTLSLFITEPAVWIDRRVSMLCVVPCCVVLCCAV